MATTTAIERDGQLQQLIERATGRRLTLDQARTLRRASMTLHRWAELACGDEHGRAIERDEETDRPYMTAPWGTVWGLQGRRARWPIADREAGALRRIAKVCGASGLHYYHQTDPRGCALYVSSHPLTQSDYDRGVAVC